MNFKEIKKWFDSTFVGNQTKAQKCCCKALLIYVPNGETHTITCPVHGEVAVRGSPEVAL